MEEHCGKEWYFQSDGVEESGDQGSYRMASSNTFFNPFWVRAEHSKYLFMRKWIWTKLPHCTDIFGHLHALGICYRGLTFLTKFLNCLAILTKIKFCAHKNNRNIRCMMWNFRKPLSLPSILGTMHPNITGKVPLFWRFRRKAARRERNRLGIYRFGDRIKGGDGRSLLGLRCPIGRDLWVCHRPWRWRSSCRN